MSIFKETADFCSSFQRLLDAINGDPDELVRRYHLEPNLQKIAEAVANAAWPFELNELTNPDRIAQPVDPKFPKLWDLYHKDFSQILGWIVLRLDGDSVQPLQPVSIRSISEKWDLADSFSKDTALCTFRVIHFAREKFEDDPALHDDAQIEMDFEEGLSFFEIVLPKIGFDSRVSFRRLRLLRIVNVPHAVASVADGSVTSLLAYLRQAQKAFILGADFGALVLLRSVLEKVLIELYKQQDGDLEKKILRCDGLTVPQRHLFDLIRKRANNLVHKGDFNQVRKLVSDEKRFEVWMVESFEALRSLIENAPVER